MVDLQIWCVVENNTVCLAASIPALRPLLRRSNTEGPYAYSYEISDRHSRLRAREQGRDTHHSASGGLHGGHSEEYILSSVSELPRKQSN